MQPPEQLAEILARARRAGQDFEAAWPKQLSVDIGHSDIRTTYNRYAHLMPGDERQATAQLDLCLDTRETA